MWSTPDHFCNYFSILGISYDLLVATMAKDRLRTEQIAKRNLDLLAQVAVE